MKKPKIEEFAKVSDRFKGNISKIADAFGVQRQTVYLWCDKDEEFENCIVDQRGRLLDRCLQSAEALSIGIPKIQDGKIVGWEERPDGQMLRYLISTLGKKEGFGESLDLTSKGEKLIEPLKIEIIDKREDVRSE